MKTTNTRRRSRRYLSALKSGMAMEPLEPRTLFSVTPTTDPTALISQANNQFAFDLLHQLPADGKGNQFFSPYSIATALETALLGAKGNTAAQIIQSLHLPAQSLAQAGIAALYQLLQSNPDTAGYTLSTANRLWVQNNFPLFQSFLNNAQSEMGAGPQSIDFSQPDQAAATINAWVSDQTHGMIPQLISPDAITPLTRLILTNAIYFKGSWAHPFSAGATQTAAFQVSSSDESSVQMMWQQNSFGYDEQSGSNGFQAIDLPYAGNNADMLVILPTASTLDSFLPSFTPDLYSQITSQLTPTKASVYLPEFNLQESYNLIPPLESLGIQDAFSSTADFSGVSPSNVGLSLTSAVHQSAITVDETGTKAAAATGLVATAFGMVGAYLPPVFFCADHPFLFVIRDRSTNTILFMGQTTDPGTPITDPSHAPARIQPPTDAGDPFKLVIRTTLPITPALPIVGLTPQPSPALPPPLMSFGNWITAQRVSPLHAGATLPLVIIVHPSPIPFGPKVQVPAAARTSFLVGSVSQAQNTSKSISLTQFNPLALQFSAFLLHA